MSGGRPRLLNRPKTTAPRTVSVPDSEIDKWNIVMTFCKANEISASEIIRKLFFGWYEIEKNKSKYKQKEDVEEQLEEKHD